MTGELAADLIRSPEDLPKHEGPATTERLLAAPVGGTVTLLFTDLVGSTELLEGLGEEGAADLRRSHFGLLRDAASSYAGQEVKTLGDGLMLAFQSSIKALSCATVMQQTIRNHDQAHPTRPLGLRIGINVGEVLSEEEDYFGSAVVVASRLCDRAEGGQVLVSELVRSLAGSRGDHRFLDLGPLALKGMSEPIRVHELLWHRRSDKVAPSPDDHAGERMRLGPEQVDELQAVLECSGLADVSLANRYSVVFAYPGMGLGDLHVELAGCSTQVCAIIEETESFHRHGIQVVGLSTEASVPPQGCTAIPFPAGLLPQDALGGVIPSVDKGVRKYAARTSYVVFPDGTGVRLANVTDVIAHVKRSFELVMERRLEAYRQAAISYLERSSEPLQSSIEFRELLPSGADSVAISRVDLKLELVCKIADPGVIAAEAGYVERINRLLTDHGCERLFPAVVSICTDEDPAWYLMEAVNPVPLDRLLFEDEARTVVRADRRELLADSLARISKLYEVSFRPETPKVARYHYLDRFLAIPEREDFKATFELLFGAETDLEQTLSQRMLIDGDFSCRSFKEQMAFLRGQVDALVQPVGAYVHGDLHLPNMLLDGDGKRVVFIDPRVVWDGNDVGDPGFCDPMYDLSTLLHSLHVMSAILRAIEADDTEALMHNNGGLLRIHENPVVAWFVDWIEGEVPPEVRGSNWQARLHVGAANALLGWLKYANAVKTPQAWSAIFASALYHLERGRRQIEGRP